ncbi:choice-of-anchor J domain-containing protein [Bacteroides propionicifaciens]|uniref:choice-of-anchor J domain-containing protein n=1 Tax=Bacteroides propionicifaciens TaxID=392838 RepID=UPI00046A7CED|nr:choice-of-anchor J domain-containing protein [Bacteroides propionicifaciens]
MKKYIYGLLACALILSSCDYNDKHFKGLEDLAKPDNTSAVEYTLLPEDYSAISKNKDNVAFAKELDAKVETEDGTPSEIYQNALKAIASNESFGELITAADFAPNFLITKWYTKDNTAAIKLTYNEDVNKPEILTKLEQAHNYTLDGNDYEQVWGEAGIEYVTDKKPLNKSIDALLNAKYVDAQKDQYAVVNYKYSIIEPGQSGTDPIIFFEDFNEFNDKDVPSWTQQNILGAREWQIRVYNNNSYLQFSANGSNAEEENYILTPSMKAQKDAFLTFNLKFRYYNGLPLSVLISDSYTDDITKATWTDISDSFEFPVPEDGGETPNFVSVGAYNLAPYADKNVVVAFVYKGNGIKEVAGAITTTVQIDEVQVSLEKPTTRLSTRSSESTVFNKSNVYKFNGTIWLEVNDVITPNASDYEAMGIDKFGKANPKEYLPKYLSVRYPYAQAEDLKTLVYLYDDGMGSAQYEYNGSSWSFVESFVSATSQFVFSDGSWYIILVQ